MLLVKYYRHYLWIFFYLFFGVMTVAILCDVSLSPYEKSIIKLPRFLNVLACFLCALLSIIFQYYALRRLLRIKDLHRTRKKWISKFIKVRRKLFSRKEALYKKVKTDKVVGLIILHALSNAFSLAPIIIVCSLFIAGILEANSGSSSDSTGKSFHKWFVAVPMTIKYISWYITLMFTRVSLFWGRKRIRNLA